MAVKSRPPALHHRSPRTTQRKSRRTGRRGATYSGDTTTTSLDGFYLAQLAAGALGVLVFSSEFGAGMIRAALTAVPQRPSVLAAQAAVFTTATLLLGEITAFTAFGLGQAFLEGPMPGCRCLVLVQRRDV